MDPAASAKLLLDEAEKLARMFKEVKDMASNIQREVKASVSWKSPEVFVCLKFRLDALAQTTAYMYSDTEGGYEH
jgi:signal transduction histidine kinase